MTTKVQSQDWNALSERAKAIAKYTHFSAYNAADPLAIRLTYADDQDRVDAANAIDEIVRDVTEGFREDLKRIMASAPDQRDAAVARAEHEEWVRAAMWRRGVTMATQILDIARESFKGRRSPALKEFDAALDRLAQMAFDKSRTEAPATYEAAQKVEREIAGTLRATLSRTQEADHG